MKQTVLRYSFGLFLALLLMSLTNGPLIIHFNIKDSSPQVKYGIDKILELKQSHSIQFSEQHPDLTIHASIDSVNLNHEAYKIVSSDKLVNILGGDAVGLMYGLLEVKNQLKAGRRIIESKEESPNLMFRAIKFNLPWDSYRRSEALSLHYETCRDTSFWEAYLVPGLHNKVVL